MKTQNAIDFADKLNTAIVEQDLPLVYSYLKKLKLKKNSILKEEFWHFHLPTFTFIAIESSLAYPIFTYFFREYVHQGKDFLSYYTFIRSSKNFNLDLFSSLLDIAIHEKKIEFSSIEYFQLFAFSLHHPYDNFYHLFKSNSIQFSLNEELLPDFIEYLYTNQEKEINPLFLNSCVQEYGILFVKQLLFYLIEDKKDFYINLEKQINYKPSSTSQFTFFHKTPHNIPVMENSITFFYQSLSLTERQSIYSHCNDIVNQNLTEQSELIHQHSFTYLEKEQELLNLKIEPIQKRAAHFFKLFEQIDLYLLFEKNLEESHNSSSKKL